MITPNIIPIANESDLAPSKGKRKSDSSNGFAYDSKRSKRPSYEDFDFGPQVAVIQAIKKPRTTMNHSYRDFSKFLADGDYVMPSKIEDMTFHEKVHALLEEEQIQGAIYWLPHGRAFLCKSPRLLEKSQLLVKYFGHNRYSSFLRQLSNHQYKHITEGKDRNAKYHEFMLRGMPHLSKYMPAPKDARRLTPDPENEPDFYAISRVYSLPDDPDFASKYPGPARNQAAPTVNPSDNLLIPPNSAHEIQMLALKAQLQQQQQNLQIMNGGLGLPLSSRLSATVPQLQLQRQLMQLRNSFTEYPGLGAFSLPPLPANNNAATVEALFRALQK